MTVKKGDMYYINPFDGGSGKGRAAVVVSGTEVNGNLDKVSVAYLSSKRVGERLKTHVPLSSSGRPCVAVLDGVTTVPLSRLGNYIGHITIEEGSAIDSALCVAFDL